jgi:hypothetical protein
MPEEQVHTAGSGLNDRALCGPMPGKKEFQSLHTAVARVDVDHHQPTLGSGADADVRVRPPVPPSRDGVGVAARGLETARDSRMLTGRRALRPPA